MLYLRIIVLLNSKDFKVTKDFEMNLVTLGVIIDIKMTLDTLGCFETLS